MRNREPGVHQHQSRASVCVSVIFAGCLEYTMHGCNQCSFCLFLISFIHSFFSFLSVVTHLTAREVENAPCLCIENIFKKKIC
jgi:hypothetical protein